MFREDDFEEIKDWKISTGSNMIYCLPGLTKNELYRLLNQGLLFIEVYDPDDEKVIIPVNRIIWIMEKQ